MHPLISARGALPALAVLFALLAGCEAVPERRGPSEAELAVRSLMAQQRYDEAAAAYLRLAEAARDPQAQRYRMRAADALIQAGQLPAARKLLAATPVGERPELALRRDVLLARVALAENQPARALELLPESATAGAPAALAAELHRLRAQAHARHGDFVAAARERVVREARLEDPNAVAANRSALWEDLMRLSPQTLDEARTPPPDTLGGWIQLARIAKRYVTDPTALEQALESWRAAYPGHPASARIVPQLRDTSLREAAPPERIALLLPFEGKFARAAEAVRNGFLSAWFQDKDNPNRAVIDVRDTSADDIQSVYARAVEAGADFVVGPLEKTSVSALVGSGAVRVPTLTLNHAQPGGPGSIEGGGAPTASEKQSPGAGADSPNDLTAVVYQFALSPEAEARRVAERAWFEGHQRAGVLTPEGAWGARVAEAFTSAWGGLGGVVIERQRYPSDAPDMSEPVERLLNVDESKQRWRALRQALRRDIKHEPRVRRDMDFIFMAAFPRQARQIRPQLQFHKAEDIPVYATSHVFAGIRDASADRDVDGVTFGDMPWVLEPDGELRQRVEQAWPNTFSDYVRLYAFGIDSYRIIPHLGKLRAQRYAAFEGQTGRLSLDAENRIQRQLMWARFEEGVPRLFGGETTALR